MKWGPDVDVPVGSIICCYKDMGYLRVDEVTPEGIIANCAFGPFLYKWSQLDDLWAQVHSTPGSPNYPADAMRSRPPRLARRGGRIEMHSGGAHMETDGVDDDARELDMAIISALIAVAPERWQQIKLDLAQEDLVNPARALTAEVTSPDGETPLHLTEHAAEIVRDHRYRHANGHWTGIRLRVRKIGNAAATYDARFDYD